MSSEYDSYAYFAIRSSLSLREIESHMGRSGDGSCWSNGDQRTPPKRGSYSFSKWTLLSGVEEGRPIDEHLRSLWRRLSVYREKLLNMPEELTASVSCVGHFHSHFDTVEIASGHFATAASYNLTLDFDFYFDDAFGQEEEGKPYWSW